jgi:hypothetical protein
MCNYSEHCKLGIICSKRIKQWILHLTCATTVPVLSARGKYCKLDTIKQEIYSASNRYRIADLSGKLACATIEAKLKAPYLN